MEMVVFVLKKIVTTFILPPGCFFIIFFAYVLSLKLKKRILGIIFISFFWFFSTDLVGNWLISMKENHPWFYPESKELELSLHQLKEKNFDGILLLGGGKIDHIFHQNLRGEEVVGKVGYISMARSYDAFKAYKKIMKPIIISGGSFDEKINSEAFLMKDFLIDLGIPEKDILLEEQALDTDDNGKFISSKIEKLKWDNVLLITSKFHLERSYGLFRHHLHPKTQIFLYTSDFYTSNRPGSHDQIDFSSFLPGNFGQISLALKEYLGLFFYLARYGK